jgi:uncharacterized protein YndB with AHSA1/START domain
MRNARRKPAAAAPAGAGSSSGVRWPEDARPEVSPVYGRAEIEIAASPAVVFAHLVRAERWPEWFADCSSVHIEAGPAPDLQVGTRFRWTVMRVPVVTTVEECEPPTRLAWSGSGLGARAYHSWILEPTTGGTRVTTEETQRGALPSLLRFVLRPLLRYSQRRWLADLARVSTAVFR